MKIVKRSSLVKVAKAPHKAALSVVDRPFSDYPCDFPILYRDCDVGTGVKPRQMDFKNKLIFPTLALVAALVALAIFLNKALSAGAPRPQDPSLPLAYYAENVVFPNTED